MYPVIVVTERETYARSTQAYVRRCLDEQHVRKAMARHCNASAGRTAGFTVVEVLTVVVIIGVLTAIALPRIDIARMQVNGAMQSIGTTLLAAQREAVTRQHDIIVLFDEPGNQIRLVFDANNDGAQASSEHVRTVRLDDRVRFGRAGATPRAFGSASVNFTSQIAGLPAVVFRRNGSASSGSGFYLTSKRALEAPSTYASDTRAIEISRAVGRAEWWRYNGSAWIRGF